jgi:hypothetical protein
MNIVFWVVIAFLIITIALVAMVVLKMSRRGLSVSDRQFVEKKWHTVIEKQSMSPKEAVLEADALLSFVLKKHRYEGSVGDQLKASGKLFRDIDGVWAAHKVRNQIAHQLDYNPSDTEIKRALGQFERALQDLRAL